MTPSTFRQKGRVVEAIIAWSAEYAGFGWNIFTYSAVAITLFAVAESWGLWKQGVKVWRERSGESLSFLWFTYIGSYFAAGIPYSYGYQSVAMIFGCLVPGLFHLPIIIGLVRYKRLRAYEWVMTGVFFLMTPVMLVSDGTEREIFYTALSFGAVASVATQAWELWREKSPGVVEIRMIMAYIASTIFWVIYSFNVGAWALMITSPIALLLFLIIASLWWYYQEEAEEF